MRQTILALAVILLATILAAFLIHERNKKDATPITMCPTDAMVCPDGSTVPRSGPRCEFSTCPQETPKAIEQVVSPREEEKTPFVQSTTSPISIPKQPATTNLFKKITTTAKALIQQASSNLGSSISSGLQQTSQATTQSTTPHQEPTPRPAIDETRYSVKNNAIVDENNKVIYTLPTVSANSSSGMETHIVNVVPVSDVAPIIGAIPVTGLPGKYYLSENSFGAFGSCQFSNRVYILDTKTNTRTLMYEENNETLTQDDPRACNSEIYLLATDNEKLVLKYHTLDTNMTCESTWSEPEKTWYLDVTHLENKTRRYVISPTLYDEAETVETSCRSSLEATTTP